MIRYAKEKDLNNEFFQLCYEGYLYHYENRKDIFKKINIDRLKEHILKQIEKENLKILLIEESNNIIGYLSYEIKEKATNSLWIDELFIKEKYRHKGYGRKLIDKIKEISKKESINRIELNCWCFNEAALKFYDELGFLKQRIIYELNEDGIKKIDLS